MKDAKPEYFATIEWLSATSGGRAAPPTGEGPSYMAPARFGKWRGDSPDEASFTLIAKLVEKLDPYHWKAKIAFLIDDAPQHLLRSGATFEFYEGRRCVGRGTVSESAT